MVRTVETSPLMVRADIGAFDAEARTVDLVFSTGAAVDRYDYKRDEYFVETLSLEPKAVRLDRLNAGASVLDSHNQYRGLAAIIGAVVPGSAKIERAKRLAGQVLMSARDEVAPILRDIKDKIIRFASVGYNVYAYRDTGKLDARGWRILEAIDWEPFEVSFVPVPADFLSSTRSADTAARVHVPVIAEGGDPVSSERQMDTQTQTPPAVPAPAAPAPAAPAPAAAPAAETRAAVAAAPPAVVVATLDQVRQVGTAARMAPAAILDLATRAARENLTIDRVRELVIDGLAATHERTAPNPPAAGVQFGEDAADRFQRGAVASLVERMGLGGLIRQAAATGRLPEGFAVLATADAGEFRGMTLLEIARESLERAGVKTRGMSKLDLAGRAFTMRRDIGGMMSPGDFPTLLENVLHKTMQAGFALQPDTWSKFAKRGSVSDFRAHKKHRMSSFSSLDDLTANGEFKNKSLGDAESASITAGTKGNVIGINRQTIVNDDLGALTDLSQMLGRAGALTVETAVYALLAQNGGLGPTYGAVPLFDASRGNIGTSSALSAAGLDSDAALMEAQKDPGGNEYLSTQPAILLVPRSLKGQANIINGAEFDPDNIASGSKATNRPNVARGLFREVIGTPRLTGTRRYMFADPGLAPVLEVVFLDGQAEPVLESQDGWRFDGVELRARMDFGVGATDYRGAVTNAGV